MSKSKVVFNSQRHNITITLDFSTKPATTTVTRDGKALEENFNCGGHWDWHEKDYGMVCSVCDDEGTILFEVVDFGEYDDNAGTRFSSTTY